MTPHFKKQTAATGASIPGVSLWIAFFCTVFAAFPVFSLEMETTASRWLGTAGSVPVVEPVVTMVKAATDVECTFTFEFPGVQADEVRTDAGSFTRFSIPDSGISGADGAPELPVYRKQILLDPSGQYECRASITEQTSYELSQLALPVTPLPVRRAIPKVPGAMEQAKLQLNPQAYAAGAQQMEPARLSEMGIVRGKKLLLLEVFPLAYELTAGRVTLRRKIEVEVFRTDAAPLAVKETKGGTVATNRLLIVAGEGLAPALSGFVAHKQALGWIVDLVTTSETGAAKEAIRNYISARYIREDLCPSHLLLVGDSDTIPAWPGQGTYLPYTDLYYACMDGSDDWLPDMAYGRLPVRTAQDLSNMVAKIAYYEASVSNTVPFVSKVAFAASSDNYSITEGTHNYVIQRHMNPRGYTSDKLYSYTYGATTTQLIDRINSGRSLLAYSGHGYWYKWRDPSFDTNQAHSLTNQWQWPVVASFACDTGAYADNDECLAESWLRAGSNAGSVAMLASSQDTYWDEDDIFEKALFAAVFEDRISRLGDAVAVAKDRYLAYYGTGTETLQYFEQYNLFGDPSMSLAVLNGTSTADPVGAIRDLPDGCVMTNGLFQVRLDVSVTNPSPSALIVKEKLPSGWTVTNATWNGSPMTPSYASGEYKWLFGMGTPVGTGTLRYSARAIGTTGEVYVITGALLYGSSNTVSTLGDQDVRLCAAMDRDGDGIPDDWELQYGLNPTNAADASVNWDGDSMSNLQEYLADTNPTNTASSLRITDIRTQNGEVRITWQGGRNAVQYFECAENLTSNSWQCLHVFPPPTGVTNSLTVTNSSSVLQMYYRIRAAR